MCSPNCFLFLPCTQLHFLTSFAVRCGHMTESGQCNVGKVTYATSGLGHRNWPCNLLAFSFPSAGRIEDCGQSPQSMWKEPGTQNDYLEQNTSSLINFKQMKCMKRTFFIGLSH